MDQHHQIPVPPDNPFEHDLLDREPTVKAYTKFLEQAEDSCVFTLNAGWGTGKTTFIRLWAGYARTKNIKCAILNALASDLDAETEITRFVSSASDGQLDVLFIDELDRCPSLRAIEFLHAIDLRLSGGENPVFVLGLNKCELEKSVRSVHAEQFDANGYLRRFLGQELILPRNLSDRKKFVLAKCRELDVPTFTYQVCQSGRGTTCEMLADFLSVSSHEIRDIERFIWRLRLISQSVSGDVIVHSLFTSCLLLLHALDRELYDKFSRRQVSVDREFDELLRDFHWNRIHMEHWAVFWATLTAIDIHWRCDRKPGEDCEQSLLWCKFHEQAHPEDNGRVTVEEIDAGNRVEGYTRRIYDKYRNNIVRDVIQRIDLLGDGLKNE